MTDIKYRIQEDGGAVVRDFLHERLVSIIVGKFWECEFFPQSPDPLIHMPDGDRLDKVYESTRSNLRYGYLPLIGTYGLNVVNDGIIDKIQDEIRLGEEGFSKLNCISIPVFLYEMGSYIKPHRDRDMFEPDKIPRWLFVIGLSREQDYGGGSVCWKVHDEVYDRGKRVENLDTTECMKTRLGMGDILVLDNQRTVHWVEPVKYGTRMTTGYRSKGI